MLVGRWVPLSGLGEPPRALGGSEKHSDVPPPLPGCSAAASPVSPRRGLRQWDAAPLVHPLPLPATRVGAAGRGGGLREERRGRTWSHLYLRTNSAAMAAAASSRTAPIPALSPLLERSDNKQPVSSPAPRAEGTGLGSRIPRGGQPTPGDEEAAVTQTAVLYAAGVAVPVPGGHQQGAAELVGEVGVG